MSDWLTPFDGSGIEWHESLPSPYTYQESDFSKLLAAVHEYECLCHEYGIARDQKITHGRHCACSACAREDWSRITVPCGMHGSDCGDGE